MSDPIDVTPALRRSASAPGRASACALALVAAVLSSHVQKAHAETFDVVCSASALTSVIATVNNNAEEDFVWLAPSCVYPLAATWVVGPDSGNPLRVHGRGATLSGQDVRTPIIVATGAALHMSDVTVRDGATATTGGGIRNQGTLTLHRSNVTSSSSQAFGGGIHNTGTLHLSRSTVSGNTGFEGGGISNATGKVTLVDSTVSGNTGSYGGGLYNDGDLSLFNSTIFGNGGLTGGGLLNEPSRKALLSNVTIAGNSASAAKGGGGVRNRGNLRIDNSIIADHPAASADCIDTGTITAVAGSLVEDGSCPFVGAFSGDPNLSGPTGSPQSFALGSGSAAIDAGQNPSCARLDQRGVKRPADGNQDGYAICDLGSYEKGGSACGLLGIEGLALLPLVGWLRRTPRRRSAPPVREPC